MSWQTYDTELLISVVFITIYAYFGPILEEPAMKFGQAKNEGKNTKHSTNYVR